MREKEVRTENLDLLMFRLIINNDNDMIMEVKNGKRTDFIRYEDFRRMADEFWEVNKVA